MTNSPSYWQSDTDPRDLKGRAELQATRAILQRRHNSLEQTQYELRKSQVALQNAQSELKEANLQLRLSKSTISSLSDKIVSLQQEILDLRQNQLRNNSNLPGTTQYDELLVERRVDEEQERYWKGVTERLEADLNEMKAKVDRQAIQLEEQNRGLVPVGTENHSKSAGDDAETVPRGIMLDTPPGGWSVHDDDFPEP